MIVRISSIAIPRTRINDYLEHLQRDVIPAYEIAMGLDSVHVVQRAFVAYVEVLTISFWQSDEAVTRFVESWPFDHTTSEYTGIEFEPATYTLLISRQSTQ